MADRSRVDDATFDDAPDVESELEAPSLGERLIGAVRGVFSTTVRATIVLEEAGRLVLSFVAPKRLEWSSLAKHLLRVGGKRVRATIDAAATTSPGELDENVTVRVTLIFDGSLPPGSIELAISGLRLTAER